MRAWVAFCLRADRLSLALLGLAACGLVLGGAGLWRAIADEQKAPPPRVLGQDGAMIRILPESKTTAKKVSKSKAAGPHRLTSLEEALPTEDPADLESVRAPARPPVKEQAAGKVKPVLSARSTAARPPVPPVAGMQQEATPPVIAARPSPPQVPSPPADDRPAMPADDRPAMVPSAMAPDTAFRGTVNPMPMVRGVPGVPPMLAREAEVAPESGQASQRSALPEERTLAQPATRPEMPDVAERKPRLEVAAPEEPAPQREEKFQLTIRTPPVAEPITASAQSPQAPAEETKSEAVAPSTESIVERLPRPEATLRLTIEEKRPDEPRPSLVAEPREPAKTELKVRRLPIEENKLPPLLASAEPTIADEPKRNTEAPEAPSPDAAPKINERPANQLAVVPPKEPPVPPALSVKPTEPDDGLADAGEAVVLSPPQRVPNEALLTPDEPPPLEPAGEAVVVCDDLPAGPVERLPMPKLPAPKPEVKKPAVPAIAAADQGEAVPPLPLAEPAPKATAEKSPAPEKPLLPDAKPDPKAVASAAKESAAPAEKEKEAKAEEPTPATGKEPLRLSLKYPPVPKSTSGAAKTPASQTAASPSTATKKPVIVAKLGDSARDSGNSAQDSSPTEGSQLQSEGSDAIEPLRLSIKCPATEKK